MKLKRAIENAKAALENNYGEGRAFHNVYNALEDLVKSLENCRIMSESEYEAETGDYSHLSALSTNSPTK